MSSNRYASSASSYSSYRDLADEREVQKAIAKSVESYAQEEKKRAEKEKQDKAALQPILKESLKTETMRVLTVARTKDVDLRAKYALYNAEVDRQEKLAAEAAQASYMADTARAAAEAAAVVKAATEAKVKANAAKAAAAQLQKDRLASYTTAINLLGQLAVVETKDLVSGYMKKLDTLYINKIDAPEKINQQMKAMTEQLSQIITEEKQITAAKAAQAEAARQEKAKQEAAKLAQQKADAAKHAKDEQEKARKKERASLYPFISSLNIKRGTIDNFTIFNSISLSTPRVFAPTNSEQSDSDLQQSSSSSSFRNRK